MTQRIECLVVTDSTQPGILRVSLKCEGKHGFFGGGVWTMDGPDYIAIRAEATKAGWTKSPTAGWRGPCCR